MQLTTNANKTRQEATVNSVPASIAIATAIRCIRCAGVDAATIAHNVAEAIAATIEEGN